MKLPWQITLSVITCSRLLVVGNEQRKKTGKRNDKVEWKGRKRMNINQTTLAIWLTINEGTYRVLTVLSKSTNQRVWYSSSCYTRSGSMKKMLQALTPFLVLVLLFFSLACPLFHSSPTTEGVRWNRLLLTLPDCPWDVWESGLSCLGNDLGQDSSLSVRE